MLSPALGQNVPDQKEDPKSRQAILAKKRQEKSLQLEPYETTTGERRLLAYEKRPFWTKLTEKGLRGASLRVGGMPSGSGFVFGLLVTPEGCPVAIEAFSGNTADPTTLKSQIHKLRERFGLQHLVMVGDRGLITQARIREELRPLQLDWITALRGPQIRQLVNRGDLQLSLFDDKDLAEIESPDYPGERLIVCRNPLLAERRASKRQQLLEATQQELDKIVQATERPQRALQGKDKIALRVGKVLQRFKVGKHFQLEITEESFNYCRKQEAIEREAALDGIYVIRSSLTQLQMTASDLVRSYKGLSVVEQAFRSFKTVDLKVRPIYHRLEDRVRAHLFLCMLAYYVQWHMRQKLAPVPFQDEDKAAAQALRESVVQPARRSRRARDKAQLKRTEQGWPVHSFQRLSNRFSVIFFRACREKLLHLFFPAGQVQVLPAG